MGHGLTPLIRYLFLTLADRIYGNDEAYCRRVTGNLFMTDVRKIQHENHHNVTFKIFRVRPFELPAVSQVRRQGGTICDVNRFS